MPGITSTPIFQWTIAPYRWRDRPITRRCRRRHRPRCSRAGSQPCEHADRCRRRWPGRRACPHRACGLGSHQRASCEADRCFLENVQDILDRLPEGDLWASKNHDIPRVAARGGCRRYTPPENAPFIDDEKRLSPCRYSKSRAEASCRPGSCCGPAASRSTARDLTRAGHNYASGLDPADVARQSDPGPGSMHGRSRCGRRSWMPSPGMRCKLTRRLNGRICLHAC
jgi:hypothetical protein